MAALNQEGARPSPMYNPMRSLTPTAQRLLAASWRLLLEGGPKALKVSAIAKEAGEARGSVHYHFGSMASLYSAVIDYVIHDTVVSLVAETASLPTDDQRIRALLDGIINMSTNRGMAMAWLSVMPDVVLNETERARVADIYEWYKESFLNCLGLRDRDQRAQYEPLAVFLVGAMDGLAIQYLLDPDSIDRERLIALWEPVIRQAVQAAELPTESQGT